MRIDQEVELAAYLHSRYVPQDGLFCCEFCGKVSRSPRGLKRHLEYCANVSIEVAYLTVTGKWPVPYKVHANAERAQESIDTTIGCRSDIDRHRYVDGLNCPKIYPDDN